MKTGWTFKNTISINEAMAINMDIYPFKADLASLIAVTKIRAVTPALTPANIFVHIYYPLNLTATGQLKVLLKMKEELDLLRQKKSTPNSCFL